MKKVIKRKEENTIYLDELKNNMIVGVLSQGRKYYTICFNNKFLLCSFSGDAPYYYDTESLYNNFTEYLSLEVNKSDDCFVFDTQKELLNWLAE